MKTNVQLTRKENTHTHTKEFVTPFWKMFDLASFYNITQITCCTKTLLTLLTLSKTVKENG